MTTGLICQGAGITLARWPSWASLIGRFYRLDTRDL